MKTTVKCLSLIAVCLIAAPFAAAETSTWSVDTAHSAVNFSVRHFLTPVPGNFTDFSGTIKYDPENIAASSVEFTVQAASIDTDNADRDQHLRSADFFDVENFPTLSFVSTSVGGTADELQVTGDLTMHGVTKQITVPVEFLGSMATPMGTKAGFVTGFKVDRKEFGINWNRVLDQGGAILGDEVKVDITIEANQQ